MSRQEIENLLGKKIIDIKFLKNKFLYYFEDIILESPEINKQKAEWVRQQDGKGVEIEKFRINLLSKMVEGNFDFLEQLKNHGKSKK